MKICTVEGCNREIRAKGLCSNHYNMNRKHCRTHTIMRASGTGYIKNGYKMFNVGDDSLREHRVIAEKALGRELPVGAVVHHVDMNRANNTPNNLVICPSEKYHHLLHIRQRAYDACGDANKEKCKFCGIYDNHEALAHYKNNSPVHPGCNAKYYRERRHANN